MLSPSVKVEAKREREPLVDVKREPLVIPAREFETKEPDLKKMKPEDFVNEQKHTRLFQLPRLKIAYKRAVKRVIVITKERVYFPPQNYREKGHSEPYIYFHTKLTKLVLLRLVVPPETWVCENTETTEVRVEKAGVVGIEETEWTADQTALMDDLKKNGCTFKEVITSFLDLGYRYDISEDIDKKPFKPFTMKPAMDGSVSGIFAFWDKQRAENFNLFEMNKIQ